MGGGGAVYCFFTSGSTGKPKGIVVEHRGLAHRVAWFQKRWAIRPGECGVLKHSYTFGLSEWEIFWPLSYGATLVLARDGGEKDMEYLHALTESHQIRTQVFVPSVLRAVLEYAALEAQSGGALWPHLQTAITCGEPLPAGLVQQFYDAVPHAQLVNLYGPTEGEMTVWSCPKGEILQLIPIGVPMEGSRVLLRTPGGSLSAIGEPGEIHFGGQFIARGYLGLDALTAEKFVEDTGTRTRGAALDACTPRGTWRSGARRGFWISSAAPTSR
ncbi:unnamed protein product [Prorocentrum cordatum]|uniref:AMP-dependent synthetase/ligase domain-containing protein n=1 Tax=Prorocentrum cordatum TaxID=2364126 RepID=A0ABN9S5J7_9DINO|nr:unnamed protein product [Polarella glacialis]